MIRKIARVVIIVCVAGGLVFGAMNRSISLTGNHAGADGDRRKSTLVIAPSAGQDLTRGKHGNDMAGAAGAARVSLGRVLGSSR